MTLHNPVTSFHTFRFTFEIQHIHKQLDYLLLLVFCVLVRVVSEEVLSVAHGAMPATCLIHNAASS